MNKSMRPYMTNYLKYTLYIKPLKHHKTKLIGLTNNPVIELLFNGKVMHILNPL